MTRGAAALPTSPAPGQRPLIMGVVNVTPDSFSDGGLWLEPGAAVEHGAQLIAQGADLLDIGGESTRPGADRPPESVELERVIPVVSALAAAGHTVSIDTMRAGVARAAIEAGAAMINDVSGGLADPDIAGVAAEAGLPYIASHWRAHATSAGQYAQYDDVVGEVIDALRRRVDDLVAAGLQLEQIILDPGFGFSKDSEHNWALLAQLGDVVQVGHPVLIGTSRKRFLGRLVTERDHATAATSLLAAQAGCWAVRVHHVPSTRAAIEVWHRTATAAARAKADVG